MLYNPRPFYKKTVGESWYRDHVTNEIKSAWKGASVACPNVLGPVTEWKLGGIELLPRKVKTEVNEPRTLSVIGWEADGPVRRKVDLTHLAKWNSNNSKVAHAKGGIVHSKKFGKARIECVVKGFHATTEIVVGHYSRGEKAQYYQGLPRLQQIRFDADDNLYICNQSDSVFRLNASGGLDRVISIAGLDDQPYGIDCIAVDEDRNLYVNKSGRRHSLKFEWDGEKYGHSTELGINHSGTKKSIAVDEEGNIFIAIMSGPPGSGRILRVGTDGTESVFPTRDIAIYIAFDNDGNICVPSNNEQAVHIYNPEGDFLTSLPYGLRDSASDILIDDDGAIYLPMFYSGKLVRLKRKQGKISSEVIASGFQAPGGVAKDSKGRIFVSNFSGDCNSIDVIYV